jgi:hypothetical protein
MSQLKHYGERSPAVIDADFRVIDPSEVRARAVRSRAIFRMVCVAPILASMLGGALNLWSGTAAIFGAFAGLGALVALNSMFDPSRLKPLAVPIAGIALAVVLILVAGLKP